MASTPKPLRKEIKHASKVMRKFTKEGEGNKIDRKSMEKPSHKASKLHAKEAKAYHHKMKGEKEKYTKAKLASAHAHMKDHAK